MNKNVVAILKVILIIVTLIGVAFIRGTYFDGAISIWGAIIFGFQWPYIGFFVFIAIVLIYAWAIWPTLDDLQDNHGN